MQGNVAAIFRLMRSVGPAQAAGMQHKALNSAAPARARTGHRQPALFPRGIAPHPTPQSPAAAEALFSLSTRRSARARDALPFPPCAILATLRTVKTACEKPTCEHTQAPLTGRNILLQSILYGSMRYWFFTLPVPPKIIELIESDAKALLWARHPDSFTLMKKAPRSARSAT